MRGNRLLPSGPHRIGRLGRARGTRDAPVRHRDARPRIDRPAGWRAWAASAALSVVQGEYQTTLALPRSMTIRWLTVAGQAPARQFLRAISQAMAPAISVTAMTTSQVRFRQPGNSSAGVRAASVRQ